MIYMLCGFIGSGKSTYARKLAKQHNAFIISNDQFTVGILGSNPDPMLLDRYIHPIENLQLKLCDQLLRCGLNVIFDRGFWSHSSRDELRAYAKLNNAQLPMIYITAPDLVMRERAIARTQILDDNETFFIDGGIWDILRSKFEPPQMAEIYETIYIG